MTDGSAQDALTAALRFAVDDADAHLSRDVVGAYRAGYDYLDVYLRAEEHGPESYEDLTVSIGIRCIPRHQTPVAPPTFEGAMTAERIDLTKIDPRLIDSLRLEVLV